MEETKKKVEKLSKIKEQLVCGAEQEITKGLMMVDTKEMGEVIDMIKDLAEAEEKCWKACYYKQIVEAMHEEEEREELITKLGMDDGENEAMGYRRGSHHGRMGYDHWRYASGRFAPAGHGHYSAGYTMPMHMMDSDEDPWMHMRPWDGSMGYDGGSRGGSSNSGGQNGSSGSNYTGSNGGQSRMGYPVSSRGHRYDAYNQARMGYHESKDAKSKEHMDSTAKEYLVDTVEGIREVWKDADPAMRKEIKNKFAALMSEMG